MKKKHVRTEFKPERRKILAFSFFVAMFMVVTSGFAQITDEVQQGKVRNVPTVEGDTSTIFSIMDHNTGIDGQIVVKESDNSFDSIKNGAWGRFQIKSSKTGDFDVVLNVGSNQAPAKVSISLYNTLTGELVADSDTASVNTGNFNTKEDRFFRLPLEADVIYTMQINFISDGGWVCNVYNVSVLEYLGGTDASLSDLQVGGATVEGFSPGVFAYVVKLPKGSTDVPPTTAVANVAGATAAVTNAATLADTTKVLVISEDRTTTSTYMVAFEVAGPYTGIAYELPGRVEFEYYDLGGEGVAFHDDANKSGDASFRPSDNVDVEGSKYTQRNVGWTSAGEWLEYTVDVKHTADYIVRGRIASNSTGEMIMRLDGDSVSTYTPTATGGWQSYAINDMDTVTIEAGEHAIRWEFTGAVKLNVDYFELIHVDSVSNDASIDYVELNDMDMLQIEAGKMSYEVIVDSLEAIPTMIYAVPSHWGSMVTVSQASKTHGSTATIYSTSQDMMAADTIEITFLVAGGYMGSPSPIPGMIEFEHYDIGGEGISYHDDNKRDGNKEFRPNDNVDSEGTDSTRINVGWTNAGEWLNYTVNVAETGNYQLRLNVSNNNGAGGLSYFVDGDSIGTYVSTSSGAWQSYRLEIMDTIAMEAGEHVIQVVCAEGIRANLDYFQFLKVDAIGTDATLASINLTETEALEGFDPAVKNYTVLVDSLEAISTMVSAVATDANANVEITQASQVNESKAVIKVTAQDLVTVDTYEVMFKLNNVAVDKVTTDRSVELYPNPVQDVLNITADNGILNVTVYSISGAVVSQYNNLGSRNVSVNLDMNNGVYFVSVTTTEGNLTQKIIKR